MKPAQIILAILLGAAALPVSAQAYKCKTPSGGTLFSDRPCEGTNATAKVQQSEAVSLEQQRQAAEVQAKRQQQLGAIQAEDAAYRAKWIEEQDRRAKQEAAAREQAEIKKCNDLIGQTSNVKKLTDGQRVALAACGIQVPEQPRMQATQAPATVTNCDAAGCWDTNGNRYNNAAGGNFYRQDGKFCMRVGNMLQCN